jgi:hypothetical protein
MVDTLLGLIGPLSVAVALTVMGLLSRRLGEQTHARRYYIGFFAAAALLCASAAAQALDFFFHFSWNTAPLRTLVNDGLPALAVTLGVVFAWRYWSWLLAERD